MKFIKIKDWRRINPGNKTPRNENQRKSAVKTMIFHNPMKKAINQIHHSNRMKGNIFWKFRKK